MVGFVKSLRSFLEENGGFSFKIVDKFGSLEIEQFTIKQWFVVIYRKINLLNQKNQKIK